MRETAHAIDKGRGAEVIRSGGGGPRSHEMFSLGSLGTQAAVETLQRRFGIQAGGVALQVCTYFDTFDWRLHRKRHTLVVTPDDDGFEVELRCFASGKSRRGLLSEPPGMAVDLPRGRLKDELEPIISIRRVLPVVTIERRARVLRILDDERKTVARVRVEERAAISAADEIRHPLPTVLRLIPVRGYKKQLKKLVRFVQGDLGLNRSQGDEFGLALSAIGRTPQSPAPKLPLPLDPGMRTDAAMKATYRALLQTVRVNVDGTREGLDSEFLHDLRVAVRRTRAALSQVRGVFPTATVERFKRDLKWIGAITGAPRDMDVYLLKFPTYLSWVDPADREVLEPLRRFLEREQAREQARLAVALGSRKFAAVTDAWGAYLDKPVPRRSTLPNAMRPVVEVASERIWRVYRKAIKEGRAIDDDTPGQAVHDLRLRCKKLRYLLEIFRGLYPARAITPPIKALKRLQDNLGDFNDYEVQQLALEGFAARMAATGETPVSTLMAMGRLADVLRQGQARTRSEFAEQFTRFARPENRDLFRGLFAGSRAEHTA